MTKRVERVARAIDLPTPAEVAAALGASMPEDQATAIAAEVYQPIRNLLRSLALRGVR